MVSEELEPKRVDGRRTDIDDGRTARRTGSCVYLLPLNPNGLGELKMGRDEVLITHAC